MPKKTRRDTRMEEIRRLLKEGKIEMPAGIDYPEEVAPPFVSPAEGNCLTFGDLKRACALVPPEGRVIAALDLPVGLDYGVSSLRLMIADDVAVILEGVSDLPLRESRTQKVRFPRYPGRAPEKVGRPRYKKSRRRSIRSFFRIWRNPKVADVLGLPVPDTAIVLLAIRLDKSPTGEHAVLPAHFAGPMVLVSLRADPEAERGYRKKDDLVVLCRGVPRGHSEDGGVPDVEQPPTEEVDPEGA